jgi:hypothetical protein
MINPDDGFEIIMDDRRSENIQARIAYVYNDNAEPPQAEADVRLIAASPDMQEALKSSNAALQSVLSGPLSIDLDENRTPDRLALRDVVWAALEANKAALAKATGQ